MANMISFMHLLTLTFNRLISTAYTQFSILFINKKITGILYTAGHKTCHFYPRYVSMEEIMFAVFFARHF